MASNAWAPGIRQFGEETESVTG